MYLHVFTNAVGKVCEPLPFSEKNQSNAILVFFSLALGRSFCKRFFPPFFGFSLTFCCILVVPPFSRLFPLAAWSIVSLLGM